MLFGTDLLRHIELPITDFIYQLGVVSFWDAQAYSVNDSVWDVDWVIWSCSSELHCGIAANTPHYTLCTITVLWALNWYELLLDVLLPIRNHDLLPCFHNFQSLSIVNSKYKPYFIALIRHNNFEVISSQIIVWVYNWIQNVFRYVLQRQSHLPILCLLLNHWIIRPEWVSRWSLHCAK